MEMAQLDLSACSSTLTVGKDWCFEAGGRLLVAAVAEEMQRYCAAGLVEVETGIHGPAAGLCNRRIPHLSGLTEEAPVPAGQIGVGFEVQMDPQMAAAVDQTQ